MRSAVFKLVIDKEDREILGQLFLCSPGSTRPYGTRIIILIRVFRLMPPCQIMLKKTYGVAELLAEQGQLSAVEQMHQRALGGYERPDHTSTLRTVNNLGNLYRNQDRLEEAGQMHMRALAGLEKALGPEHPSTLRAS